MAKEESFILRIRGVPWSCTHEEIGAFFKGRLVCVMCVLTVY